MINAYLDPYSYNLLSNAVFDNDPKWVRDDCHLFWSYLKAYCQKRNINLRTIDFWNKNKATGKDIYISFGHKHFIKKFYWHLKNKNYPIVNLNNFKKRILFHSEPPIVTPDVYGNINCLFKIYDEVFFISKLDNPKCHYFCLPRRYENILPDYWNNSNRKFLTMINRNKPPRNLKKFLLLISSGNGLRYLGHKELLSERIKIIDFFSKTNEIDLYGTDWDKRPFFPYWFYKKSIQKVYKGPVESKCRKLSEYNFAITIENSAVPGYITNKPFDCFYTGTVPIYLGAPDIEEYIPKNCFIDMRNFRNYEELRQFLKSLTKSEIENYRENARNFLESEKFKPFTKEYFAKLFVDAISD